MFIRPVPICIDGDTGFQTQTWPTVFGEAKKEFRRFSRLYRKIAVGKAILRDKKQTSRS